MKSRVIRSVFSILLPCAGFLAVGMTTVIADPPDRVGADAPHQERNQAKNAKKSALPLSEVTVPAFSGTQKPVKKAIAVKETSAERKAKEKEKKKADQQAKEKQKADAAAAETAQDRQRYDTQLDDFVGSDAPHQERSSDTNKRAARLFILER